MNDLFLKVKGIVRKEDGTYLVIKRWMDDRIPDPFAWEFFDGDVQHGESPDMAVLRAIRDTIGVEGNIEQVLYTWSHMIEDTQCVGIAYLCSVDSEDTAFVLPEEFGGWEWIAKENFEHYIDNPYVLQDLKRAKLP